VVEPLRTYSKRPKAAWKSVKYKAHTPDFSEILWPQRYDREFFISKRNEYLEQGLPDVYSQEFLNQPLDESLAYFKRHDFKDFDDVDRERFKQKDWKKFFNFYIGTDLAVSLTDVSDWSVFVVGGMDESGYLYIVDVIRERMDAQDIVETILALQKKYEPEAIQMEKGQIEKSIGPFLRQRMLDSNVFPNIIPIAPSSDKLQRAKSIQGRMRAGAVKFDKAADWYFNFEDEAVLFPRGKHDDQVDAFAYIGLILDKTIAGPSQKELEEEEYEEEYTQSGLNEVGRSLTTGY
jgi:predicted phage terminase large subunit-like protein